MVADRRGDDNKVGGDCSGTCLSFRVSVTDGELSHGAFPGFVFKEVGILRAYVSYPVRDFLV